MRCDADVTLRFRQALGKEQKGPGPWKPHVLMPYVLGGPTLHLKLAVLMFLVGLFYDIWHSAVKAGLAWRSDDMKVPLPGSRIGFCYADDLPDRFHRYNSRRFCRGELFILDFDLCPPLHPDQLRISQQLVT